MADDRVYLSDVIEVKKFKKGQANIVVAPCHSGKTTAAVSKIAPLASYPAKVLILIDSTAGRDALAKTEEIQKYSDKWLKEIESEWWGSLLSGDGIRVMTYHQFGYKIQENPHFLKDIEVLICDEMHNLIKYIGIEHGINKNANLLGTKGVLVNDLIVGIEFPGKVVHFRCHTVGFEVLFGCSGNLFAYTGYHCLSFCIAGKGSRLYVFGILRKTGGKYLLVGNQ